MFGGLGTMEIALILLVALLVLGPDQLPKVARTIGKGLREMRRATSELRLNLELDGDPPRPSPVDTGGGDKLEVERTGLTGSSGGGRGGPGGGRGGLDGSDMGDIYPRSPGEADDDQGTPRRTAPPEVAGEEPPPGEDRGTDRGDG